jgi:hypothetical protein
VSVAGSVALNAIGHLVSAGHMSVGPGLVITVSAVPPIAAALAVHLTAVMTATGQAPDAVPEPQAEYRHDSRPKLTEVPVVPAGVRLLPIVAAEVTTEADVEVTVERAEELPQTPRPLAADLVFQPVPWPPAEEREDRPLATAAVPAQAPRQVVTSVVTLSPAELRKRARRLHRQVVTETGRPVTIERLRSEFGLSRRDAAELRREVVTPDTQAGR